MYNLAERKKMQDLQKEQSAAARTAGAWQPGIPNSAMLSMLGGSQAAKPEQDRAGAGSDLAQTMQSRMEAAFGAVAGVQVHYNSDRPKKVNAEAYAQGDHIYLGPGQEKHLAHELGHVVQQRRGGIPTTERIDGVAANTDARLEREADTLGRQFEGMLPTTEGGVSSFGPASAVSAPNLSAPVQMAGHKGVMVFGNGKLMKRVEKNEYLQFRNVKAEQEEGDDEVRERALAAFPRVYAAYTPEEMAQQGDSREGYNPEKFKEWKDAGSGDDYYIEMESLGGRDVSIKDFKVGTTTAKANELFAHGHKNSWKSAQKKQKRMNKNDDARSETKKYGLRDSDEIQKGINPLRKFLAGQNIKTLANVRAQVGGRHYAPDSQVIKDLEAIEDYFRQSDTVYIASSVIIKWNNDPGKSGEDRARLIDLAHPFSKESFPAEFEEVKSGMLLGIRNVKNLLLGNQLESSGGMPAPQQMQPAASWKTASAPKSGEGAPPASLITAHRTRSRRSGPAPRPDPSVFEGLQSPQAASWKAAPAPESGEGAPPASLIAAHRTRSRRSGPAPRSDPSVFEGLQSPQAASGETASAPQSGEGAPPASLVATQQERQEAAHQQEKTGQNESPSMNNNVGSDRKSVKELAKQFSGQSPQAASGQNESPSRKKDAGIGRKRIQELIKRFNNM